MTRYLPRFTKGNAKVRYHALRHMNVATLEQRQAFIAEVRKAMVEF